MVSSAFKIPLYAKASILILGILALFAMLYIGREIIVPIILAVFIAIILHPVVIFLVRKKVNRILAIALTLLLTIIIVASFFLLLISQASSFNETWPLLVDKFTLMLNQSITSLSQYLDINPIRIHEWIAKTKAGLINSSTSAIGQTIAAIGSMLVVLFLLPVYVFLILFYHPLLIEFIRRLFAKSDQAEVGKVITQIKTVIQRYLIGLIIEAAMVAFLNAAALLILGIEYAILIGIIGAMLNVIPYIGGLVAVALPMIIAIATKSSAWYALYVLMAYYFIQLVDNNYIVPYIVASKVKINALFSIIIVLAGNALWGITGMFLSIPLLAIIKVVFDHVEPLKPWGFLLGDDMPSLLRIKPILTIIKKKPQ